MNKYLITGFSGFVGQHFVEYLENIEKNCLVKGLDIQNPDFRFDNYKNVQISFEKIDLLSKDQVEYIIHEFQPNYILHLASYSSVALSWKEPIQSFQNNTNIFLNLIDAVRKLNIDTRILSVGSSEEYGNANYDDLPLKENHKLNPISPYAVARISQEYLSEVYVDGYGMDIVLTRSFNHIGPMQKSVFVVSSLAKQLVEIKKSGKSKGCVVTGDVSIVRDFTDVRDVVRAYYLLLKEGKKGHVYNVCSGIGLSIKDLIDIMAKQLNIEVDINIDNRLIRPADNKKIIGSNEKIKRELGWQNNIPLEQSLKDIIIYWEANSKDMAMAERNAQIAALYHSTNWRITWPLRIVGNQLKISRRIAERAMSAIQRGGLKNTLKKAIQLYRREGLAGIKRSFRIVATSEFDRNDYAKWIRCYDTLTDESRATMRNRIDNYVRKPLISLVMPVYNTKPEWLIQAIESVRKQIYPCWELCIADDASTDKRIRPILESYAREDTRIKVIFRKKNGHISAASNDALELATGEWVALLDHDDILAEHALFWVADAINRDPDVRLIYSDEDKIDRSGRRFGHYFKCDWNVDLFYSHNLITHLGVYRASLLNEIGGFKDDMEGAQDYDLALRCIERIEPKQIRHIPRVLYHWRAHAKSTAQSAHSKPYAMLAGQRALNEHLGRQGVRAQAELIGHGFRVRYALPDVPPLVSLIILTRNGFKLIQQCVNSILRKTTYPNYEIIIVDNGSDDPTTLEYFRHMESDSKVRILRDDRTFNFSALNNSAVNKARGELVGLINNDIEVISPDWLSEMVSHALRPDVGAVGACLWYPGNTLQHGGVVLGIGGWAGHAHKGLPKRHFGYAGRVSLISEFMAVTGACLIIRKSLYEELGGLNEAEFQIACNDVDFCLRLRKAGYRNIWTPYAELYHYESATRGFEYGTEKQARFAKEVQCMKQRWGNQLLNDPCYSPNLTLDYEDFSLAWPPRVNSIT